MPINDALPVSPVDVAQFKPQAWAFLLFFAFPHCSVLDGSKPITPLNSYSTVEVEVRVSFHCTTWEGREATKPPPMMANQSKKINRVVPCKLNSLDNGSGLRDGNGFNIFILTSSHPSIHRRRQDSIKMAKDEEVEQSNKQLILVDLLMRYRSISIHHLRGSDRNIR